MAYGLVLVFDDVSEKDYWAVNEALGIDRDGNGEFPAGMLTHVAGPVGDGGWVVIETWDSKASQEAFMATRLGAALGTAGVHPPSQMIETNTINEMSAG